METVIQVIFNNESDAFEAKKALARASDNFDVDLGESYIIKKSVNGGTVVRLAEDESTGEGLLGGAAVGGLIGLLGGPIGVGIGLIGGMIAGGAGDIAKGDDIDDYLNSFGQKLSLGETMLVAHLREDAIAVTDKILKPYGGTVTRLNVDEEIMTREQAEIDEMDREVTASEAAWAAADMADKAEWDAKVKKRKQNREDAKLRRKENLANRKERYQTWANGQKEKFNSWKKNMDDKNDAAKKERLEKRIDKQKVEMQSLQSKYEAI